MNGLHSDRLKPDRDNPREVAFAEQWGWENRHHDLLNQLLMVPCSSDDPERCGYSGGFGAYKMPCSFPGDRDRRIAATLMQWLGSNVGFSFLQEALAKCGYKIVKK